MLIAAWVVVGVGVFHLLAGVTEMLEAHERREQGLAPTSEVYASLRREMWTSFLTAASLLTAGACMLAMWSLAS